MSTLGIIHACDVDNTSTSALYEEDSQLTETTPRQTGDMVEQKVNGLWDRANKLQRAQTVSASTTPLPPADPNQDGKPKHPSQAKQSRLNILASSLGLPFGDSGRSSEDVRADALDRQLENRWDRAQDIAIMHGSNTELNTGDDGNPPLSPKLARVGTAVVHGVTRSFSQRQAAKHVNKQVSDHWSRAGRAI